MAITLMRRRLSPAKKTSSKSKTSRTLASYRISGKNTIGDPILFNLNMRRKYKGNVIIKH